MICSGKGLGQLTPSFETLSVVEEDWRIVYMQLYPSSRATCGVASIKIYGDEYDHADYLIHGRRRKHTRNLHGVSWTGPVKHSFVILEVE